VCKEAEAAENSAFFLNDWIMFLKGIKVNTTTDIRFRCENQGLEINAITKVLEVFANPSVSTERVHLFVAECDPPAQRFQRGGLACEGEDIEIMEIPANQVTEMIRSGMIKDSKTILLFLFATVHRLI
jgi:GDP-mannose pyrophosphatase NudK